MQVKTYGVEKTHSQFFKVITHKKISGSVGYKNEICRSELDGIESFKTLQISNSMHFLGPLA
jgi:hypothetical protein